MNGITMAKRSQQDSGAERVAAKSKPMMNLVARCSERTPTAVSSIAFESPVTTIHESQTLLSPQTEQHYRKEKILYTHTHQPILNGKLIKLGFNWWTIERSFHNTRTNSLLKTLRRSLTPKQNRIVVRIHIILYSGIIECEILKTNPLKMQRKTATYIL